MLELYQAEWCPASRRVRQRLTELGLDFVARQVPVDKAGRLRLSFRTGTDSIPVLVDGWATIVGEDSILAYLAEHFEDTQEAQAHRAKAAEMHPDEIHRRYSNPEATPC
jgi:glutaredoxin 3